MGDNNLGGTCNHQVATAVTPFRSQVDDPIATFEEVQVVFHHHRRIALVHQPLQNVHQFLQIVRVEAGSGFIQQKETMGPVPRLPGPVRSRLWLEISDQFQALGLPARQGAEGLSQA